LSIFYTSRVVPAKEKNNDYHGCPDLDQARQYFAVTRSRLEKATTGLTDAQARFKPAPDCWSIAEILEHLATAL